MHRIRDIYILFQESLSDIDYRCVSKIIQEHDDLIRSGLHNAILRIILIAREGKKSISTLDTGKNRDN